MSQYVLYVVGVTESIAEMRRLSGNLEIQVDMHKVEDLSLLQSEGYEIISGNTSF